MSENKTKTKTEAFLILKYGSMQQAYAAWVERSFDDFSLDEHNVIIEWTKKKFPNLNLTSIRK
jgi:hypothetical protein